MRFKQNLNILNDKTQLSVFSLKKNASVNKPKIVQKGISLVVSLLDFYSIKFLGKQSEISAGLSITPCLLVKESSVIRSSRVKAESEEILLCYQSFYQPFIFSSIQFSSFQFLQLC